MENIAQNELTSSIIFENKKIYLKFYNQEIIVKDKISQLFSLKDRPSIFYPEGQLSVGISF